MATTSEPLAALVENLSLDPKKVEIFEIDEDLEREENEVCLILYGREGIHFLTVNFDMFSQNSKTPLK